eukprot:7384215-Alexandrium_andersonii.AAC.1
MDKRCTAVSVYCLGSSAALQSQSPSLYTPIVGYATASGAVSSKNMCARLQNSCRDVRWFWRAERATDHGHLQRSPRP